MDLTRKCSGTRFLDGYYEEQGQDYGEQAGLNLYPPIPFDSSTVIPGGSYHNVSNHSSSELLGYSRWDDPTPIQPNHAAGNSVNHGGTINLTIPQTPLYHPYSTSSPATPEDYFSLHPHPSKHPSPGSFQSPPTKPKQTSRTRSRTKHGRLFPCPFAGCPRNDQGFDRRDNLLAHRRSVHNEHIPRGKAGRPRKDGLAVERVGESLKGWQ